jgi:T5orf172 domain
VIDGEEMTKVGYSDQPQHRIAQHRDWCAETIEAESSTSASKVTETVVLSTLDSNGLIVRGEWARIGHEDARELIEWVAARADRLGPISLHWRDPFGHLIGLPAHLATLLPCSVALEKMPDSPHAQDRDEPHYVSCRFGPPPTATPSPALPWETAKITNWDDEE